jgi:hypothetical protein
MQGRIMPFYQQTPSSIKAKEKLAGWLMSEYQLAEREFSFTWIQMKEGSNPIGAAHLGDLTLYPASVVKLFYMVAAFAWIESGDASNTPELQKALSAMIKESSNDATSYIVDLLTNTSSGAEMKAVSFETWLVKRRLIHEYFQRFKWEELERVVITQKTWEDRPYGREHMSRLIPNNRNLLTTHAVARLLMAIQQKTILKTTASCDAMMQLMHRPLSYPLYGFEPSSQRKGFLGEGLLPDCQLWSKAGWTSNCRHDAAIIQQGKDIIFFVIFLSNPKLAKDEEILPKTARHILENKF